MRRALATGLLALALASPAQAQPPVGIVRPDQEQGKSGRDLGAELYAGNCVSCHGVDGRGVAADKRLRGSGDIKGAGPSLRGVGAGTADFYLRTGYMPLAKPTDQPRRGRVLFREREIRALVDFVSSLDGGPPIPTPHPERGEVSKGLELFTERCAGCHQVVTQGGVVTGARVPPLQKASPQEMAEAVRAGPYVMPKFSTGDISDSQLDSIIAYVQRSKHPVDRGGWGLGNLGPMPEGAVTWFIAALAFVMACVVIGRRIRS